MHMFFSVVFANKKRRAWSGGREGFFFPIRRGIDKAEHSIGVFCNGFIRRKKLVVRGDDHKRCHMEEEKASTKDIPLFIQISLIFVGLGLCFTCCFLASQFSFVINDCCVKIRS